jgi:hypothetical protein
VQPTTPAPVVVEEEQSTSFELVVVAEELRTSSEPALWEVAEPPRQPARHIEGRRQLLPKPTNHIFRRMPCRPDFPSHTDEELR